MLTSIQPTAQLHAYAEPAGLIAGIDLATATHDEIIERLGQPRFKSKRAIEYDIDGAYMTFTFLRGSVLAAVISAAK